MTLAQLHADKPLPRHKVSHFRALAARANYLAADRPDCQYAAKKICRWMDQPTEWGVLALKRLARYLVGKPRLIWHYRWQQSLTMDVYSDTDWAGCLRTRKSTSGGCVVMGESHAIKTWSSTQQSTALSSGEAEMVGVTKAATVTLGIKSLLADFGVRCPARLWTDSSAAVGMCSRQGLGKARHLDVQTMWVQQRVRCGDIDLYNCLLYTSPSPRDS